MTNGLPIPVDAAGLAEICHRYQVSRLSVFGSTARGQQRPDSDVDLLVEFCPGTAVGMIHYAGLMLALSGLLGRPVDLVTRPALRPALGDAILGEARLLYAA
jgi:predicted nucleotidyltransferase